MGWETCNPLEPDWIEWEMLNANGNLIWIVKKPDEMWHVAFDKSNWPVKCKTREEAKLAAEALAELEA